MNNLVKRRISKREADALAEDINSWWGKTFIFIKKTRVKTWKGIFILAFSSGTIAATIWMVSFNIQTSSKAATEAGAYPAICNSFVYSDWSACQPNGKQVRTVISREPSGCVAGNLVLEQECEP
jgi:hypothetical protein